MVKPEMQDQVSRKAQVSRLQAPNTRESVFNMDSVKKAAPSEIRDQGHRDDPRARGAMLVVHDRIPASISSPKLRARVSPNSKEINGY